MPVILATQETNIRRIVVQIHPWQIVPQDPILKKNPSQKIGMARVAQGVGPEFKTRYHTQKKNLKKTLRSSIIFQSKGVENLWPQRTRMVQ
jgi:hypothetical protein